MKRETGIFQKSYKDVHSSLRREMWRKHSEKLERLHQPSLLKHLGYMLFPVLLFSGMICGLWMLNKNGNYWLGLPFVLTAIGMNSCFLLIHEATHGILCKNEGLNWISGAFLGLWGFISFTSYRVLHNSHHQYLGTPLDPDEYENLTKNVYLQNFLQYNRIIWGTLLYVLLFPFVSCYRADTRERYYIFGEYLMLTILVALFIFVFGVSAFLFCWVGPFVLTNWMINMRGFTQHGATDPRDPYGASRTVYPAKLIQFFLIYENFHLEHHLFPGIPGYNLPKANKLMVPAGISRINRESYLQVVWRFLVNPLNPKKILKPSPFFSSGPEQINA